MGLLDLFKKKPKKTEKKTAQSVNSTPSVQPVNSTPRQDIKYTKVEVIFDEYWDAPILSHYYNKKKTLTLNKVVQEHAHGACTWLEVSSTRNWGTFFTIEFHGQVLQKTKHPHSCNIYIKSWKWIE